VAHLDSAAAAKAAPNYLFDELPKRLAKGPVKYHLFVQLATRASRPKGIELSDDPLAPLRSAVYALSVAHRH
jgi:hypothetical protein